MISVILNAYNRVSYLDLQIKSIKSQTIKPKDILIWQNDSNNKFINLNSDISIARSSYNFGVWSRFAYALNCKTDYICIFDDDTIPGANWLKNCFEIIEKKNGLLGSRGVRFASDKEYIVGDEYGWNRPHNDIKEVDIVGHSWFFRRDWLSTFWRELPDINSSFMVGEDIHFSYTLQKYMGISTYVPPHPEDDKSLWGGNKELGIKIGTDKNAISYNKKRQREMDDSFKNYINKGFKLKFLQELRFKNILLKSKKKIKKLLND